MLVASVCVDIVHIVAQIGQEAEFIFSSVGDNQHIDVIFKAVDEEVVSELLVDHFFEDSICHWYDGVLTLYIGSYRLYNCVLYYQLLSLLDEGKVSRHIYIEDFPSSEEI